ncbi:BadF/BadG/BcrA/BcrD ATPase family protein [Isoptericola halotolerans]|uniref:BadF/BadG/BcrA/BcrD ATPase family protein n=1 Tax=Isoptericola halotolerans TaxID=300560 RepID=UPI0038907948
MSVLGIDVGGSGSRVALRRDDDGTRDELAGPGAQVGARGSSVAEVVRALLRDAAARWPGETATLTGVGIGATGLTSLVEDPGSLAGAVTQEVSAPVAVAADAVTAHLGALGGAGGAVVALGTGAIAVGHGGPGTGGWRRVDGWGHLLGDRGSGAWIGRQGLEAALRTADGVDTDGAALLAAGRRRFGEPATWPGQLYTRPDRAGVLAAFAADVARLSAAGDPASLALLATAGDEAAVSVLAALGDDLPPRVALTGGMAQAGGALTAAFADGVAARRPDVEVRQAQGDPLDGALHLARLAAEGTVVAQEDFVWT